MKRTEHADTAALTQTLIGRDSDLAALIPFLDAAAHGAGSAVVLSGAGGVGKTRLAETVGEEAQRRGFRVASGRAFRVETGVPYALFADAFTSVIRELDPSALATLTRGAEAELAIVLPALGSPHRAQSDDPTELRSRVLWTVAEFVRALSARDPLLLLLDDLHWADVSSLELLHFVARQITQSRVLILCTYNESEGDNRPELRSMEQSLLALGIAHVHNVGPLTLEQTGELVRSAFGTDDRITGDFSTRLYNWTRGNVFFVRETLQSLVDTRRLRRREDGTWLGWEISELELPGTVRDAVVSRLRRLSPAASSVAETAAVIGTRFDHELLRAAMQLPEIDLLAAIDELRHLHIILESTSAGELRYDFAHPMLRQVLYTELGTARCRRLHGVIAQSLERRYGGDAPAHADELAFHFARAEANALEPKALQYLHAAGRHALARFADREAVDYLRLARERWTVATAVLHEGLLSDLARAHQRLGEYDAAIALWLGLLPADITPPTARGAAALHRRLGQAYYWSGRYEEALEHYNAGIALVARDTASHDAHDVAADTTHHAPSDDAHHGARDTGTDASRDATTASIEAVLRLAAGICLQELGRADEAGREIDCARRIAEAVGDTALLARTHRALLLLHIWTGPPDEARVQGARAAQLAREVGDVTTEFYSEWGLAVLEGLTGHTDAMAKHVAVIERIAHEQRSPLLRLWTAELSIEMAAAVGDWDRGIAVGEHAIGLARSLNQRTLLPRLLVWTSLIHLGRSDIDIARTYIDEAWTISNADSAELGPVDVHSVVPAHIGRAALHIATRDFAEAIRICERGLAIADRTGYTFWAMHRLLPLLAEAHCHLWDVEGALAVEQRIRRDAEQLGHKVGLAWADSCRALAVWLAGDPAGATRLIRDACESLESIPMLPDAARLRRQLAGRLAETGDRDGALQELRKVHDLFVRMGAEDELSKARGMFREIGAKPPARAATTAGAEGLTGREIEIARMVAERRSNKAIARSLDISPRTVSTHLSNIFRKLDVGTRGELADYIRDRGVG
jgi:DNA-binding CsgD family transcriptional regulator/tetratricopeptide (TPR) repeat protein